MCVAKQAEKMQQSAGASKKRFPMFTTVVAVVFACIAMFYQYMKMELRSAAKTVPDVTGKTFLVTGANVGLGLATVVSLAKEGGEVVMACRNMQKCEAARQSVLQDNDKANVACLQLDVSSFESVKSFAKTFKGRYKKIDVLINNAGVMALPTREVTKDGLEMQIATNHYGHFLLTSLLLPMITKNGRIVNHSSGAHTFAEGNFPYENLSGEKYDPWVVYGNTKLANLHFTYALNRKLAKSEKFNGIKSIAVQPGYTSTNLQSGTFLESFNPYVGMTPADGALSQILAAADPAMSASEYNYFGPKYGAWGAPALVPTLPTSWDVEKQEHLWKESTRITKTKFHNL